MCRNCIEGTKHTQNFDILYLKEEEVADIFILKKKY